MGRTLLIIAAVLLGYAVVYLLLKKKIARTLSSAEILREIREEVDRLQVELNQTTNRNITLLEDRIAALGEALGKADRKIALVRRETEKRELAGKLYSELSARRAPTGGPAEAPPPAGPQPAAESPAETPAGALMEAPEEAPEEAPDKRAQALRLAQGGLAPSLIARRLGLTLGEVELILSLAELER